MLPLQPGVAMANEGSAAVVSSPSALRSGLRAWIYIALASSFLSLFRNAAFEVKIFQIFIGVYRTIADIFYDALEWPGRFGWPYPGLVRDLTTQLVATLVATSLKLRKLLAARDSLSSYLQDVLATQSEPEAPQSTTTAEPEPIAAGITTGGLIGLMLGGPVGLLVGGLLGGLGGVAAAASSDETELTPGSHAPVPAFSDQDRLKLLADFDAVAWGAVIRRILLCLAIGTAVLLFDSMSNGLIVFLERVDGSLQAKAEELGAILARR